MKKVIISILLLILILGGCKYAVSDYSVSQTEGELSINDASTLVREILPSRDYPYYVEYEGTETFKEELYYVFRAFTVSSQTIIDTSKSNPIQMQFTQGVYYVNPYTREVFELSVGGDHLIKRFKAQGDG